MRSSETLEREKEREIKERDRSCYQDPFGQCEQRETLNRPVEVS